MKQRINSVALVLELVVLIAPLTLNALFGTVVLGLGALASDEVEVGMLVMAATPLLGTVGLAGIWGASIQALTRDICSVRPCWWWLIGVGALTFAFGALLLLANLSGIKSPAPVAGFVLAGIVGWPAMITAIHLLAWRAYRWGANNSFKPNPLRGSA